MSGFKEDFASAPKEFKIIAVVFMIIAVISIGRDIYWTTQSPDIVPLLLSYLADFVIIITTIGLVSKKKLAYIFAMVFAALWIVSAIVTFTRYSVDVRSALDLLTGAVLVVMLFSPYVRNYVEI